MKFIDRTGLPRVSFSSYWSYKNLTQNLAYLGIFPVKEESTLVISYISEVYSENNPNISNGYFFVQDRFPGDEEVIRNIYAKLKEKNLLALDPFDPNYPIPSTKNFTKKVERGFIANVLFTMCNSNFMSYYGVKSVLFRLSQHSKTRWIVSYESSELYSNANVLEYLGYGRFHDILDSERKAELFKEYIEDIYLEDTPDNEVVQEVLNELDSFKSFVCSEDFKPFVPDIVAPL